MKRIISWLFIVLCTGGLLLSCKTEKALKSPPAPGIVGTTSIPYYFDREITEKDLERRTMRELSLMRNTIYARAGTRSVAEVAARLLLLAAVVQRDRLRTNR